MANKVLFMGCNSDQVPYLKAIKALGYTVIGTDMNAKAPGAPLTDRFYKVGYTNLDGLKEVARSEQLSSNDLIFTAAAHFAYEGASKLAAFLLSSQRQLIPVSTKLNFIRYCKNVMCQSLRPAFMMSQIHLI